MKNKKVSVEMLNIETIDVFDTRTAFRILLTTFTFVGAFAAVFPILTLDLTHALGLILCAALFSRLVIGPPTRVEFTEESARFVNSAINADETEEE